ncbi:MAG: YlxR family protein [Lachnospiraceae bacterium]|nr:YlxR family protein [Lachnospiraceae bacterium]
MAVKKIPLRQCVGCREQKNKKELIRVIRSPEGEILIDATGKKNGRGAYICNDKACLAKAKKSKALERSLNVSIPEDVYQRLDEELSHIES